MTDAFSRFKQQLDFLKKTGSKTPFPAGTPIHRELSEADFPPGWHQTGEFSFVKTIQTVSPVPLQTSDTIRFQSMTVPVEDIVFFDIETTGLSGGAGTVAFLIGAATIRGNDLVIQQFFLADYPGEPDFLLSIGGIFTESRHYVSYNGKGFDSNIIRTRFRLNGMEIAMMNQIDLLYLARRFWKRIIGGCSLGDIEEKVLGCSRTNDIPGYLIPEAYFDFLRTRDVTRIASVFTHNETDIISLARLFALVLALTDSAPHRADGDPYGCRYADVPLDRTALGAYLLFEKPELGIEHLENSFETGDINAGLILASFFKRKGELPEAAHIWEKLWELHRSVAAVIECAKYHEHVKRDATTALQWTESPDRESVHMNAKESNDIKKRKARLIRKIRSSQPINDDNP